MAKALYESGVENDKSLQVFSMHDGPNSADGNTYFPSELFKGFGAKKMHFIYSSIQKGKTSDVVIISHINLLVVGWMIKKISPATKLILFAHGIEIWNKITPRKRMMLESCDQIICVSRFTAGRTEELHKISAQKIRILNNCLDPYLPLPENALTSSNLRNRYGFSSSDKILLSLTRISSKERYKGYDNVLKAMVNLIEEQPSIRYLLAGSYDKEEKQYIDTLVKELGLGKYVVLPGYIADEELAAHFSMSDIYVMPSMKEGFGIVFIEAMYYGLPVIAGNRDGSVDALCNGELGLLIDPLNVDEIRLAIKKLLEDTTAFIPNRDTLIEKFGYAHYKKKLVKLVSTGIPERKTVHLSHKN